MDARFKLNLSSVPQERSLPVIGSGFNQNKSTSPTPPLQDLQDVTQLARLSTMHERGISQESDLSKYPRKYWSNEKRGERREE